VNAVRGVRRSTGVGETVGRRRIPLWCRTQGKPQRNSTNPRVIRSGSVSYLNVKDDYLQELIERRPLALVKS
jgi:hypothetical protein